MSRVIVVTSGKGGVGKTTITAGLGVALAKKELKVCLIDADLGLKNLDVILGIETRVIYDILDVFDGKCSLEKALVKDKKYANLSLLPACKTLDVQKIDFTYMQKIINELKLLFDVIIIDSPAGIERGFFNAIKNATEAIVVATLDIASARDADKVIGILNANSITDIKLIINKVSPTAIANSTSLSVEDVLEVLSIPLLGVIYDDESIQQSNNQQQASLISEKTNSGRCFNNIAKRINGEEVDITKYKRKNFLSRIFG